MDIEAVGSSALGRRAEIFGVSTRRPWRKRGIARGLMIETMRGLGEHGIDVFALGVDTDSPTGASRVYEALGYEPWEIQTVYCKKLEMGS